MLEILALTAVVLLALWAEHRRETALWGVRNGEVRRA